MNWPCNKESHAYMKMRQNQNRVLCERNKNENWVMENLNRKTIFKWTRQSQSGFRLFDFWNGYLGIGVEVDGPEHNVTKDLKNDNWHLKRRGILVLRIRNNNQQDLDRVIKIISFSENWNERRKSIGLREILIGKSPENNFIRI